MLLTERTMYGQYIPESVIHPFFIDVVYNARWGIYKGAGEENIMNALPSKAATQKYETTLPISTFSPVGSLS